MSQIRGRFNKPADETVTEYTASIDFDCSLYLQDIEGSIVHAKMLGKQGIITQKESRTLVKGLTEIRKEIEEGKFTFDPELEDIHMNIEARLMDKIGEVGGKLHTSRSRNDQVALDMRLFTIDMLAETLLSIRDFQEALVTLAEKNKKVAMPGYTHLQPAQPVLFAHHILAYFEMLQRDFDRFADCWKRTDVMPLGSGAVAGAAYNIDREFVAKELGFSSISENSMDAVSDRDFVIEYETAASICMMHLSRLAEELVLWSSAEFNYIELDDAYTTGSSIMPQKKNPDVAELARGKTGRVYGNLMAILTTMKGLPLTYNRDLQEDKEGFFDTVDTLLFTLDVFTGMIKTLKVNSQNMKQSLAQNSYILATDLADYLVKKGESFRSAHEAVGKLVTYAIAKGKPLNKLKLSEIQEYSPLFDAKALAVTARKSIAARNNYGGTSLKQVNKQIGEAKKIVESIQDSY